MEKIKDIIEVYKKRRYNELLIEKREKIEKIENEDKFRKLVNEYNKKLEEALKTENKLNVFSNYAISISLIEEKTASKIEEVEKWFKDEMDERDRIVEEVRAIESLYETTEELIDIYKKYGILQEDGKIYDYRK